MLEKKKFCTMCGRMLPLDLFGYYGKEAMCKFCREKKPFEPIKQPYFFKIKEDDAEKIFEDVYGGWALYILNSPGEGEFRYSIISTTGIIFQTNNRNEFLEYMKDIETEG